MACSRRTRCRTRGRYIQADLRDDKLAGNVLRANATEYIFWDPSKAGLRRARALEGCPVIGE